ncbi:MFS transporter [Actinomadura macra]|uniref:MFS transporter n=1 Tax=Actinomadura macra TaxID=46164 RepID=UPI000B2547D3|nr:MFS transporter [Actinomadura macra]
MSTVRRLPVIAGPPDGSHPPDVPPPPLRRNRDFLLLWSGAAASLLGTRVSAITYPLLVVFLTGSGTAAGLVGFAALLPNLIVQLPAGALVDRWNRKWLMTACNGGAALALGSVALALAFGRLWLPHLVVAAFVESSLTIFYKQAERGAVRNLVPPSQLSTALAQNEARGRAAGLLGQPLGTTIYGLAHWWPTTFTALSHLFGLCGLLFIRKDLQRPAQRRPKGILGPIRQGLAWVWHQRFLRTVMVVIAGSNLLFQGISLALAYLVEHDKDLTKTAFAVILVARGVGGVLGAATGPLWMRMLTMRSIVIWGNITWAVLLPLIAVVRDPVALGAIFIVISVIAGTFNVVGGVYLVRTTPDRMQGRAGSVMDLLGSGLSALGPLVTGVALDTWGARPTVLGLGAAMVCLALATAISPAIRSVPHKVGDIPLVEDEDEVDAAPSDPPAGDGDRGGRHRGDAEGASPPVAPAGGGRGGGRHRKRAGRRPRWRRLSRRR